MQLNFISFVFVVFHLMVCCTNGHADTEFFEKQIQPLLARLPCMVMPVLSDL